MSRLRTKLYRTKEKIIRKIDYARYGKCAVLLYHRVCSLATDPQLLAVSPENFKIQLAVLKKEYHLLKIKEFEALLESGNKFPERSVLITFDDGYADNYQYAMPILEQYKTQALFYISTGNIDSSREFWWDEIERLVLLPNNFPKEYSIVINGETIISTKETPVAHKTLYDLILPFLRSLSVNERQEKIKELQEISFAKEPREQYRSMSLEELKKFSKSTSVEIGAHTKNHPSLAVLDFKEQLEEISSSKDFLEKQLDKKITHFSYPFGTINDFNSDTEKVCADQGFEFVAANYPNLVTGKTKQYNFPRFLIRDWNGEKFKNELTNFFNS